MTHPDSIRITHSDKTCPDAVASHSDKPFRGYPNAIQPEAVNDCPKVASGYVAPSLPRKARRHYAAERALHKVSLLARPGASFALAMAAIRLYHPVGTSGRAFEAEARQAWDERVAAAADATDDDPPTPVGRVPPK